jgi:hypothetical protein
MSIRETRLTEQQTAVLFAKSVIALAFFLKRVLGPSASNILTLYNL